MNGAIGNVKTIAGRELYSYFATPIAYVFTVIFLLLAGAFMFIEQLGAFFLMGQAQLNDSFFRFHPWLYMVLVPAVGMRLWSEEKRGGTVELLFTLPTTPIQAIIAKYVAGLVFLFLALVLTFPAVITVNYLGEPDMGVIISGYVGSFLVAASFLAVSSLISALTRSQVVAFIISMVLCFCLILAGLQPLIKFFEASLPGWVLDMVASFSVLTHYSSIQRGVIDSRDVLYFLSLIGFALFGTTLVLNNRRA